jgi:hypothetical protein
MLYSYKNIPFSEIYLFILLDDEFIHEQQNLTDYIYNTFSLDKDKIHLTYDRYIKQSQWIPVIQTLVEKHGENELVWFTQNDDHVFIDFNMDILNEGLEILKNEPADHKSIYFSHWPEIIKLSGKYSPPTLVGNYVKFNLSLLDSIQIFNLKFLHDVCVKYKWKSDHIRIDSVLNELTNRPSEEDPLTQTIFAPLREMVRHFDGYDHVHMDRNACPPLKLPSNTFYYSKESLINKMTAYHVSAWTKNNNFQIPQKWIDINLSLHPILKHHIPHLPKYRAIILVLASNNNPIYINCRKVWKVYMNVDPTIKVFFVYGKLSEPLLDLDSSDIIIDVPESYPVYIKKTIEAMKIIHASMTYDFFIRTNLTTFWDFKNLHLHLNNLPTSRCYSGDGPLPNTNKGYYLSGTDTIVTPEMIQSIITNEHLVDFKLVEDAAMGKYFNGVLGVPMLKNRICFFEDITTIDEDEDITKINKAMSEYKHHYIVKTPYINREIKDMLIYKQLLKIIYNENINI